jgi:hypothetical protein
MRFFILFFSVSDFRFIMTSTLISLTGVAQSIRIDMKARILNAPKISSLRAVLTSALQYKIAVSTKEYIDEFPAVFERGTGQYGVAVVFKNEAKGDEISEGGSCQTQKRTDRQVALGADDDAMR